MAGKRSALTTKQVMAMRAVKDAAKTRRDASAYAREEGRKLELKLIADAEHELDVAIKQAHEAGVPKIRISQEGVGHQNPKRVKEGLARMGIGPSATEVHEESKFALIPTDDGETRVSIKLQHYPTTSLAADYPDVLEGIARLDDLEPNGWAVEEDSTDMPGMPPGHLHWEIERRKDGSRHLADELTAWAEAL